MQVESKIQALSEKPLSPPERDRFSELHTVIKISNIIGYLPLNLEEILDSVVLEVYRLFRPYSCAIHLVREKERMDLVVACGPYGLDRREMYHKSRGIERCKALRDGLPVIINDGEREFCENRVRGRIMSHVCIPIIGGKEHFGTISMDSFKKNAFTTWDLEILLSIANQISLAIQRANLFAKVEKEKRELEEANREIRKLNTALKQKIKKLETLQVRLLQSEKIAALGRLAAGLAHEINNPSSIILNRIECLLLEAEEKGLPDDVLKDLRVISAYAEKISSMVRGLLIFSRSYVDRHVPVDMVALMRKVVETFREDKRVEGFDFHIIAEPALPMVAGDGEKLEQVFMNLIDNAIDAMPQGGTVEIVIRPSPTKEGFVEIGVRDRGKGIPKDILSKIFDPFFTTKKIGKGTGLGLSISMSIVKGHGGDILVESEPGRGSTFTVLLPRSGR